MPKISPEAIDAMERTYHSGKTLSECSQAFGCSISHAYNMLNARGVIRRNRVLSATERADVVTSYVAREPAHSIMARHAITNVTIHRVVTMAGVARTGREAHPPLPADSTFFDVIDTEPKAYWLGFLAADGCVFQRKNAGSYIVRLSLASKDGSHVATFKNDVQSTASLSFNRFGTEHSGWSITINNQQITAALIRHGLVPRKTYSGFDFPSAVTGAMIPHFIRGYLDGDGCFYKRQIRFSGHMRFLRELREVLNAGPFKSLSRVKGCLHLDDRCAEDIGTLIYGGRGVVLAAYPYLYTDASRYLERKHTLFRSSYLEALLYRSL